MNRQQSNKKYDVFLSHNGAEKNEVEIIARKLEKRGIVPFLDKWHLVPGEPWQESLEEALERSSTFAVLLVPSGLGPWENEEMRSALEDRARNKAFRVIPVLLPGAHPGDPSVLPRFLRRLTWVDFRSELDTSEALENLIAGIYGFAPKQKALRNGSSITYLKQGIIHALPPAPVFVGRNKELLSLRKFWDDEDCNILSLIGLGGAGKTALTVMFLSTLLKEDPDKPNSLFVWSFYIDQNINNFLRMAYHYFSHGKEMKAAGVGMLYRLIEVLANRERHLIVMDGLERVQRPQSDLYGAFGELDDPLLRQVVSRLTLGVGRTKCLITSRFPISDLHPWQGKDYKSLEIDQLERADARLLLRKHKVTGNDNLLDQVISEYGAHALTLDHLGTYLAEFCDGDPLKANQLDEPRVDSDIREERKLARVFYAYEKALNEKELDLLKRFCIFRFGVTVETLYNLFSKENKGDVKIAGVLAGLSKNEF